MYCASRAPHWHTLRRCGAAFFVPFVDFVVPALKAKSRKAVPRAPSDGACHRTPKRALALMFFRVFLCFPWAKKEVSVSVSTLGIRGNDANTNIQHSTSNIERPIEFFVPFMGFVVPDLKAQSRKAVPRPAAAGSPHSKKSFRSYFFVLSCFSCISWAKKKCQ